jgi:hypothetical protein
MNVCHAHQDQDEVKGVSGCLLNQACGDVQCSDGSKMEAARDGPIGASKGREMLVTV